MCAHIVGDMAEKFVYIKNEFRYDSHLLKRLNTRIVDKAH